MKFLISYLEKTRNCCPPSFYWVAQENIVIADDIEDAKRKLQKGRHAVEIKDIQPID